MNSMAILYTMKSSQTPREEKIVTAEVHVNYWKVPKKGGDYNRFLDFGVMINEVAHEIDSIFFYFPFKVEDCNVSDLGVKLKESALLCTLFNADMRVQNINESPSYSLVTPEKSVNRKSFWLYELGSSNFKINEVKSGGCLLQISIKSQPKRGNQISAAKEEIKRNLYFRFRVSDLIHGSIFCEEPISNDFIQSAFSRSEMMDLRINDIREMDKKVFEDITEGRNFLSFTKFHFFFIGSSEDEKIEGNILYKDCRLIDPNRWANYMNGYVNNEKKCIAYHWKQDSLTADKPLSKCSVFLRTIYSYLNWKKLCKYIGVIILLNIISNVIFQFVNFFL